jgi:hypothetical protein
MDAIELDVNFNDKAKKILDQLLEDESWTWYGLANYIAGKITIADLDELISCLQIEMDNLTV